MSISQNFPEEGPTLNLNFAGSKTLDPRITFSRTTTGTYMDDSGLIKVAPADAPRFDHRYVNGEIESLGLLVEEARTNLFTRSEEITTDYFGGGGTIGTDTILNPYGISSSVSYVTTSERVRNFNADGYSTLAFSFFSKKRFGGLERDYTKIEIFQVAVGGGSLQSYDFNFDGNNSDGTYVKDVKTEQYPNGWYRFSCRLVARADYNGGTFATNSRVDIEGGYADNYVWGIQVEAASFATSYMPTSASQFTRNPDNVSMTGENFSDWYNSTEGTIVMDCTPVYDNSSNQYRRLLSIHNNSGAQTDVIQFIQSEASNQVSSAVWDGASFQTGFGKTLLSGTRYKVAFAVKENNMNASYDGNIGTDDTSATLPVMTRMDIGSYAQSSSTRATTHYNSLRYYPTRLTNTQLQTLTK